MRKVGPRRPTDEPRGLDGTASGHLSEDLFGSTAEGEGNINGDGTVLFSPDGTPKELEVTASGDGVWHVAPPSHFEPRLPESIRVKGSEAARSPLLSLSNDTSEGSGYGSEFAGTLDLSEHPEAEQDVNSLLQGDSSKIDALINDNTSGDARVWSYKIDRSDSSYGPSGNFVVGAAGHVSNGTATMQDSPPEIREDGGKWHSAAGSP